MAAELIYQRLEIRQTCCHEKEERRMAKLRLGVVGLGMGKGRKDIWNMIT